MTIERHGPEFVKDQQNFVIYDALLYRTSRREPKKMLGSPSMGWTSRPSTKNTEAP